MVTDLSTIPLLPPQDEEYARQLQMEWNAMSDVHERGEGVTVSLHGDLQSTLTVSHLILYNSRSSDLGLNCIVYCLYIVIASLLFSVYHFHRMRIMLVSYSLSSILVHKVM